MSCRRNGPHLFNFVHVMEFLVFIYCIVYLYCFNFVFTLCLACNFLINLSQLDSVEVRVDDTDC